MSDTVKVLAEADDATLDLIKREADAYLAAQLTVALAGNQRAMTFFGFLAAASAVIGGASVTALASQAPTVPFAWIGVAVVAGFLVSMFLATKAALPDAFSYVGNTPDNWVDDVRERKNPQWAKAESLADSARCIERNRTVLKRSATLTTWATRIAWASLAAGGATAVAVAVGQRFHLI